MCITLFWLSEDRDVALSKTCRGWGKRSGIDLLSLFLRWQNMGSYVLAWATVTSWGPFGVSALFAEWEPSVGSLVTSLIIFLLSWWLWKRVVLEFIASMVAAMNLMVPGNLNSKFVGRPTLKLVLISGQLAIRMLRIRYYCLIMPWSVHFLIQVQLTATCSLCRAWLVHLVHLRQLMDPNDFPRCLAVSLTWVGVELRVWSITGKKQCVRPLTKLLLPIGQSGWSLGLQRTSVRWSGRSNAWSTSGGQ